MEKRRYWRYLRLFRWGRLWFPTVPRWPVQVWEPPVYPHALEMRRLQGLHRLHRRERLHRHLLSGKQVHLRGIQRKDPQVHRQVKALWRDRRLWGWGWWEDPVFRHIVQLSGLRIRLQEVTGGRCLHLPQGPESGARRQVLRGQERVRGVGILRPGLAT